MAENKKDILKMAMIYTQEGKWDKAITEYKKLITLDPTDYNIHNMLGDVYAKKGEDALAYQSYILTAEAYIKQGLSDKAAIIYKKIAKLDSNKLPETDRKKQILIKKNSDAEKLIENGEIEKAIEVYKEILQINPDSFDTYQKIGELYAEKGMKEESLKFLYKVAEIYHKNRIYKKALPIYQKIVEMQPDNIEMREKLAEVYEREGDESGSKREYIFLCEYYLGKKNIEKVEFFAQKAIEAKSIEAHFFKGVALFMKKDFDEAKKEMDILLKFKANHTEGLLLSAKINIQKGQLDQAMTLLSKVIKLEEENTEAYEIFGDIYLQKGLNKEANAKFMIAVNIYSKKKEFEKAESVLNKILSKEPENSEVLQKLAEILALQNKKKQAADIYIKIAELYKKENMESKEREFLKMAEELEPAHPKLVERAKKLTLESKEETKAETKIEPKVEPVKEKPVVELKKDIKTKPEEIKIIEELPPIPTDVFATKKQEKIKIEPVKTEEFKLPDLPPDEIIIESPVEIKETVKTVSSPLPQQLDTQEDVPALLAMAEGFIKTGDFEQAIEMYQKALALEPSNETIKTKLNKVYSQYAGISSLETSERKKQEAEKKKKEEEEMKRQEEERKKQEAEKKKQEEEERKKQEEEERKKQEEEKKKKEEEKKRQEEEIKKQETAKIIEEKDAMPIFSTVISAEIFIKQGLFYEAEKILNRIIKEDADNIEAKTKLDELIKLKGDGKEDTEKDKKKTTGKISYI